jgi:hypothetical protein
MPFYRGIDYKLTRSSSDSQWTWDVPFARQHRSGQCVSRECADQDARSAIDQLKEAAYVNALRRIVLNKRQAAIR